MTDDPSGADLREDGFLGGRLRIAQPAQGYRAGADAVMLAAACPARPGQSVLELGCGAGVALMAQAPFPATKTPRSCFLKRAAVPLAAISRMMAA